MRTMKTDNTYLPSQPVVFAAYPRIKTMATAIRIEPVALERVAEVAMRAAQIESQEYAERSAWDYDYVASTLSQPGVQMLTAKLLNGTLVGYLIGLPETPGAGATGAIQILNITVRGIYQRRKIGKRMINEFKSMNRVLVADTWENNLEAQLFFKAVSFRCTGIHHQLDGDTVYRFYWRKDEEV